MKLFFSTFMLIAVSSVATAQSLTVGVKAGSSTTTFRGDYSYSASNMYDNSKTNSLVLTEYLNYKLTSMLSVQAELSYQKKGFEYKTKRTVVDYAEFGNVEFGYLQIPLLLQFSYGGKLKVFSNGGPSVNILVSDGYFHLKSNNSELSNSVGYVPLDVTRNIKSDFNKVTLGLVGSAGVSYDITSTIGILGEFRIGYDLTKSAKNKEKLTIYTFLPLPPGTPEPLYYKNTHFLSYTVQGGVYFKLSK